MGRSSDRSRLTIRRKVLLAVGASALTVGVAVLLVARTLVLGGFERLEETVALRDLERAREALGERVRGLSIVVEDYAHWDDTVAWIHDRNPAYVESNLVDHTFRHLHVELILFFDGEGQLAWSGAFDPGAGRQVPVPPGLAPLVDGDGPALLRDGTAREGLLALPEGPLLVAVRPILRSEGDGPVHGTLAMGRRLDSAEVAELARLVHADLVVLPLDDPRVPAALREGGEAVVLPLDAHRVDAWASLRDLRGEPALALRQTLPREILKQGRKGLLWLLLGIAALGAVLTGSLALVLGRVLVRPLERLAAEVDRIREEGDPSRRVRRGGDDELGRLAAGLNGMLAALEVARGREEAILRESEERFRAVVERSPDAALVACDGVVVYANPAAARLLGAALPAALHGRALLDLVAADGREALDAAVRRAVDEGEAAPFVERRYLRLDGSAVDLEDAVIPHVHRGRAAVQVVARDVGARRRAEAARDLLGAVIEQAGEGFAIAEPGGGITWANPAFERITGYRLGALLGRDPSSLAEDPVLAASHREAAVRTGSWSGHARLRRRDGTAVDVQVVLFPIRDRDGRIVRHAATVRDVSRERQVEAQLAQAQKMEAVGRLAGGVAHDFNNLLTVILSCGRFLEEELAGGAGTAEVRELLEAAERAATLTRQLLAFSRKGAAAPRWVDLGAVASALEKLLRRLIGEDVRLEVRIAPALWPVHADPGQLEQVIVNFAVNARDAMPGGGTLAIAVENVHVDEERPDLPAGDWVALSVSDTGTGMSAEVMGHLFEPFFTTKAVGKGTGLGLSTVYGIVRQAGGRIRVESEPGRGSTFTVHLPRSVEPGADAARRAPVLSATRGRERILVVEDEPAVRNLTCRVLERAGYRIAAAAGVAEARALLAGEAFDLVLSDVVMPDGGGRTVAEEARRLARPPRLLLMSGYAGEVLDGLGPLPLVEKPFTPEGLAAAVRQVLDTAAPGSATIAATEVDGCGSEPSPGSPARS